MNEPTLKFIYKLHDVGFDLDYLFFGQHQQMQRQPSEMFSPENIDESVKNVFAIEKLLNNPMSDESRLKLCLLLMQQHAEILCNSAHDRT